MGELLRLGQADTGERAHAGVYPVHRGSAAKHLPGRRAPLLGAVEQLGTDSHGPPGGDLADQRGIEVLSRGERAHCGRRMVRTHRP